MLVRMRMRMRVNEHYGVAYILAEIIVDGSEYSRWHCHLGQSFCNV